MAFCPSCKAVIHGGSGLETNKVTASGRVTMFACKYCGAILGFAEE